MHIAQITSVIRIYQGTSGRAASSMVNKGAKRVQQGRNKGHSDQHPWGSFRLKPSLTIFMAHCACRGDAPHLHRPALRHIALPSVFTTASATASQHRPILPVRKEPLLMTAFEHLPWACDNPCAHTPHLNDQVLTHGTFTAASATDFSLCTNGLLPAPFAPTRVSHVTVIPLLAVSLPLLYIPHLPNKVLTGGPAKRVHGHKCRCLAIVRKISSAYIKCPHTPHLLHNVLAHSPSALTAAFML